MENQNFFKGTEKKIELVIDPSLPFFRERGSESGLFVFDHKIIMIIHGRAGGR